MSCGGAMGGAIMCGLQALDSPENAHDHRVCIYLGMCGLFVATFRVPLTGNMYDSVVTM